VAFAPEQEAQRDVLDHVECSETQCGEWGEDAADGGEEREAGCCALLAHPLLERQPFGVDSIASESGWTGAMRR
jgi:hypothetical protein